MNLNFEISLADLGVAIEYGGNSESERQEIMDFLIDVDRGMADLDWSVDLISALAISTAEDMEATDFKETTVMVNMPLPVPGLPEGAVNVPMAVKVPDLVQGLADQTPHLVVQIMANALFVQREAAAKAAEQEDPPCTRCGCPRELHRVNVGGERTGCFDHDSCDEWKQDKSLPLSTVCVCGHTLNYHDSLKAKRCTINVHVDEDHSTESCECEGFEEDQ